MSKYAVTTNICQNSKIVLKHVNILLSTFPKKHIFEYFWFPTYIFVERPLVVQKLFKKKKIKFPF